MGITQGRSGPYIEAQGPNLKLHFTAGVKIFLAILQNLCYDIQRDNKIHKK